MKLKEKIRGRTWDKPTTGWLIFIHAGCLLAPFTFTWSAFWVCLFIYVLTGGLGIALCYHRLLAHRSFTTPKPVEYFLTILGCVAAQRSPIYWVARHRQHHAASDTAEDPHTPQHGFIWSHMIWPMMDMRVEDENEFYGKLCPDLANDAGHRWIQKTHEIWPLLAALGLFLVGGLPWLVWGFFVRTAIVYHVTWLVNSLGHLWGYQNYNSRDDSRNNPLVALLAFGDGWHNNHHAYPGLAQHGHRWWEVDPAFLVIRLMERFGLAAKVRALDSLSQKSPAVQC